MTSRRGAPRRIPSEGEVKVPSLRERLIELRKDQEPAFPEFAKGNPHYPSGMSYTAVSRYLQLIQQGNYPEVAATVAGLRKEQVQKWIRIGEGREPEEEAREPYITFAELTRLAETEAETLIVGAWTAQTLVDWKAGAALVARRNPDRWGKNREESSGSQAGQSIHVTITPIASGESVNPDQESEE